MANIVFLILALSTGKVPCVPVSEMIEAMPSLFQLKFNSQNKPKATPMIAAVNEMLRSISARPVKDQREGMLDFLDDSRHWALTHPASSLPSIELDPAKLDIFALIRREPLKIETRTSVIRALASRQGVELDPAIPPNSNVIFGGGSPFRCDQDLYATAAALVRAGYYDLPPRISGLGNHGHKFAPQSAGSGLAALEAMPSPSDLWDSAFMPLGAGPAVAEVNMRLSQFFCRSQRERRRAILLFARACERWIPKYIATNATRGLTWDLGKLDILSVAERRPPRIYARPDIAFLKAGSKPETVSVDTNRAQRETGHDTLRPWLNANKLPIARALIELGYYDWAGSDPEAPYSQSPASVKPAQ